MASLRFKRVFQGGWWLRRGLLPIAVASALAGSSAALGQSGPIVSEVTAAQRSDGSKIVDIRYRLTDADGDACTIAVQASGDGGATWTVPVTAVSGDVGAGIAPGAGKHITWTCAADLPGAFGTQYKVRVQADDGHSTTPPGMVLIPGGSFEMGDTFNEGWTNERPVHTVTLSAFSMDRYEVTKGLWDTVRTWAVANGYDLIDAPGKAPDHPVHSVNWYDCVKWANARSQREGRTPCYYTNAGLTAVYKTGQVTPYVKWGACAYRLPTEAEWEKAARGSTPGHRFPWSDTDTIQHARANYHSSSNYPYDTSPTRGYHPTFSTGESPYTSPVGYFAANGYGLYDMAGNVWEWCNDWWSDSYYASSPGSNPAGPLSGTGRVLRGGSWYGTAQYCRCAGRTGYGGSPYARYDDVGFRLALDSE